MWPESEDFYCWVLRIRDGECNLLIAEAVMLKELHTIVWLDLLVVSFLVLMSTWPQLTTLAIGVGAIALHVAIYIALRRWGPASVRAMLDEADQH